MYPPKYANWNILYLGNLKKICDKLRGPRRVLHSNDIKKKNFYFIVPTKIYTHQMHPPK